MPRLMGYRERLNLNIFDCLYHDSIITDADLVERARHGYYPDARMFGATNLGQATRTNMTCPYMLASDRTAVLTGWYARASFIDRDGPSEDRTKFDKAYDEVKQVAELMQAQFLIGCKPMWQAPVADLLRRNDLSLVETDVIGGEKSRKDQADEIARTLAKKHKVDVKLATEIVEELAAKLQIKPNVTAMVPMRQSIGVNVSCPREMHELLGSFRDRGIRASLWVHLVGIEIRDIQ